MSHFTTIETQIRDEWALEMACAELGLELLHPVDGVKPVARGYNENRMDGDFVVKLKGPYDVALNKKGNGYAITADWWAGHVAKEIGEGAGKLLQEYGVAAATLEARKKGYSVRRQTMKDGSVKLTVGVMGSTTPA